MTTDSKSLSPSADPSSQGSLTYLLLVCFVATLGGLLFGYDTAVISGTIEFLEAKFFLSAAAKGWAASSALAGCVLGCAVAGWFSDRFGRKKVLVVCALLFILSAVGSAIPEQLAGLVSLSPDVNSDGPSRSVVLVAFTIFRLLGGIGVGAASMTSPMYIAEISPAPIRGRMVSLNQLAIVVGMLVIYFVNYFIGGYGKELDHEVVARESELRGSVIDPDRITQYLRDNAPRSMSVSADDPKSISAYEDDIDRLVAAGDPLQASAVVDFLDRYDVRVDETDVRLVGFGLAPWNVARGWRWMFASETIPALALLVLLLFVPESPRWLTKQSRTDEALAVLSRVNGAEQAHREVTAIERAIAQESGSLAQLLAPRMRIVLVIGIALATLQQVTGINVFLYFGPEIFRGIAGAEMDVALLQTLVIGAVNLVFTIVAIWTVDLVGRKPLMLVGFAGMGISLLALGLAAYVGRTEVWLLTFILTYIGCFALSVGPVTWVILSEIFPTRIRGRALAIATVCLWSSNLIISQTFPMLNKNQWLVTTFHHAFPFWLYGAFSVLAFVFVALFVRETKGRTLEEIEQWWV